MSRRVRYQWFERRRDGTIVLHLFDAEVGTLLVLISELRELLEDADASDPAYRRLFPNAYLDPTEEEAEQAYAAFAHSHLLSARLDQLRIIEAALDALRRPGARPDDEVRLVLDDEGVALWLGTLNDVRLALGAALHVTDREDPDAGRAADGRPDEDPDVDPDGEAGGVMVSSRLLYEALTSLQGELLEVLQLD